MRKIRFKLEYDVSNNFWLIFFKENGWFSVWKYHGTKKTKELALAEINKMKDRYLNNPTFIEYYE